MAYFRGVSFCVCVEVESGLDERPVLGSTSSVLRNYVMFMLRKSQLLTASFFLKHSFVIWSRRFIFVY